jgi:hypothetical protein
MGSSKTSGKQALKLAGLLDSLFGDCLDKRRFT